MIKKLINRRLNKAQKVLDKMYEEERLTDEVLQLQLEINKIRAKYNIHGDGWKQ